MWDFVPPVCLEWAGVDRGVDMSRLLIEKKTARFYAGLARESWMKTLEQIRGLPERTTQ